VRREKLARKAPVQRFSLEIHLQKGFEVDHSSIILNIMLVFGLLANSSDAEEKIPPTHAPYLSDLASAASAWCQGRNPRSLGTMNEVARDFASRVED